MADKDITVSGWYESDEGVAFLEIDFPVKDAEALAMVLYGMAGGYILGADMEFEGEYADGKEVEDLDLIHYLDIIGDYYGRNYFNQHRNRT
jgi:hypothetical protein